MTIRAWVLSWVTLRVSRKHCSYFLLFCVELLKLWLQHFRSVIVSPRNAPTLLYPKIFPSNSFSFFCCPSEQISSVSRLPQLIWRPETRSTAFSRIRNWNECRIQKRNSIVYNIMIIHHARRLDEPRAILFSNDLDPWPAFRIADGWRCRLAQTWWILRAGHSGPNLASTNYLWLAAVASNEHKWIRLQMIL